MKYETAGINVIMTFGKLLVSYYNIFLLLKKKNKEIKKLERRQELTSQRRSGASRGNDQQPTHKRKKNK